MMKALIFAAALLFSPAALAKTWVTETCVMYMSTDTGKFVFGSTDGVYERTCEVSDWPINDPIAELACDDGSTTTMTFLDEERLLFNDVVLYPAGDSRVICD